MTHKLTRKGFIEWLHEQKPNEFVGECTTSSDNAIANYLKTLVLKNGIDSFDAHCATVSLKRYSYCGNFKGPVTPNWARLFLLAFRDNDSSITARTALAYFGEKV